MLVFQSIVGIAAAQRATRKTDFIKATAEIARLRGTLHPLFDGYLAELAIALGLDGNDRISLYAHFGNGFYRIGRYSSNPVFRRSGRKVYPDDEGCIGRAWTQGDFSLLGLPNFSTNDTQYVAQLVALNLNEETIRALSMKSRGYWAVRIERSATEQLGVLVVESLVSAHIQHTTWRNTILDASELAKLAALMHNTSSFLPDTEDLNKLLT